MIHAPPASRGGARSAFTQVRLVDVVLDVVVNVDVAVRVERSGAICLSKNYFSPLISCVLRLIRVVRCSVGGSRKRQIKPTTNC